jgi:hypothetical protein
MFAAGATEFHVADGRISTRHKRLGLRHDRSSRVAMPAPGGLRRATWFAAMMAILLAFTWQGFVAQTHRHYGPAASANPTRVALQSPGKQSPSDLPATCPICSELAHAGQAVLPAPVAIAAPAESPVWLATTIPLRLSLSQRSHAWQSRAPPAFLQA